MNTIVFFLPGYSFITQIPEGSWDIQIIERKKSADILGVHILNQRHLIKIL